MVPTAEEMELVSNSGDPVSMSRSGNIEPQGDIADPASVRDPSNLAPSDSATLFKVAATFRHHADIEPRFRDTDAMGHVNNAVYVTYLEVARQSYWRRMSESTDYGQVPFVVARIELDLRSPLQVGEVVRAFLRTNWISRSSFEMEYALHEHASGRLIASARTVLVTYDYARQVSIPVPESVRQGLEKMEGGPLPGRASLNR